MLDALRVAGTIAGLMKDKDKLKAAAERIKAAMAELRCEGSSGGGAVRVIVNGEMRVLSVRLAPALAAAVSGADGATAAEGLIAEATNEALARAKDAARQIVTREAEAMGLGDFVKGSGGSLAGLLGA